MIIGYHHAQVTAPSGSSDETRRFYGIVLGLKEIPVPPSLQGRGLIWFEVGNGSVHVGLEDGVDRLKTRAHLAYEVDDIDQWRARMAANGVEIISQPVIDGYDRIHINDPFGNRIEIIGRVD